MVKRFSIGSQVRHFYEDEYETHFMEEDTQGGYVKYEDYLAMVAKVDVLHTELEKRKNAAARRTEQWKAAVAKCSIAEKLLYAATKIVVRTKGIIPFFVYDLDENLKKECSNFVYQTDEECLAQVRADTVMDFAKEVVETGELSFSASDFVADFANQYVKSIWQEYENGN